ncbi:TerD family protein [Nocardia uniformis]|uniref:TerD family protein n=1 Tax=Nocardia uniformis TaxID=53432 RepID=A0A849CEP7_9NOCA|nr:TerD family protein [Nocardia uniformis]NNH71741.1 TerD family protein [Nocardia uniformis]
MFVTLRDETGAPLNFVGMALGWDPAQRRRFGGRVQNIDLNAAALLFSGADIVDVVYHEQLSSRDGSVRHHGDSVTGEGTGDVEVITVDLTRMASQVTTVIFLVTSYGGQTFEQIDNAFCRLFDGASSTEIARYNLDRGEHTGFVMGRLFTADAEWHYEPIGAAIFAGHPVEAVTQVSQFLV